jgi:Sulfotransferase domain
MKEGFRLVPCPDVEASTGTTVTPEATPATTRAHENTAGDGVRTEAGALPNLIVIGAQKCGTSGLHYYLSLHPEISVSRPKELNFFIEERNWPKGVDWYRSHFDANAKVRSEASPNYTAYPQHLDVPERMHSVVPDAKLLYMVRDPIDRIAAHWVHNYAKRREKGDLRTTLLHPNTSYLVRSHYYAQLQRFLRLYPFERVIVIEQEELRNRRLETLRRIFEFAGVDPGFSHPGFATQRHRTSRKRRGTPLTRVLERIDRRRGSVSAARLRALGGRIFPLGRAIEVPDVRRALPPETLRSLRDDAERLRELTGLDLSGWSIWDV